MTPLGKRAKRVGACALIAGSAAACAASSVAWMKSYAPGGAFSYTRTRATPAWPVTAAAPPATSEGVLFALLRSEAAADVAPNLVSDSVDVSRGKVTLRRRHWQRVEIFC